MSSDLESLRDEKRKKITALHELAGFNLSVAQFEALQWAIDCCFASYPQLVGCPVHGNNRTNCDINCAQYGG
jgi:hypothetical protein